MPASMRRFSSMASVCWSDMGTFLGQRCSGAIRRAPIAPYAAERPIIGARLQDRRAHEPEPDRAPRRSALARLILVDGRLYRGFHLLAGGGVLFLGVVVAPVAQLVGIALEVRVHVARHQLVA